MAMILDAFLSKFSELLVQMAQDEVGMLLGIPGQIEKLNKTLGDIQCVLADAERKQSKGSAIERWLRQLKDVMYDADDVIDLCQTKAKARSAASSSHSSTNARFGCHLLSCFRNPLFAHEIGYKIKDINSRLQDIAKSKASLGLTESPIFYGPFVPGSRVDSMISRKTDPAVVLADIVGEEIEEDTELLVNWLIEEEKDVRENIVVAAIVGMGGIGKTTLAKRIFNDQRIGEEFQLKIWVCISKEVKGVEVLKCMIREAGGDHGAAQERSELVALLERTVQKKKFLLVLDDVWQESQAVWYDLLRAPLSGAAHGSRLLITTRDERVVNGMRAARSHRVSKLSNVDGWSLLIKQVAPNRVEREIQDFMEIGMQIVEKCDGLPLAIKIIGGVLRTKGNTRGNWEAILRSNVWSMDGLPGDVHRAFYLSYEDLPSPLKQCFIFCSLFPEDCEIYKVDLFYMWLAEGFLHDKEDFWELGDLYYKELIMRNLLEGLHSNQRFCKMHDLLWSFARQLGKDENCVLGKGQVLSKSDGSLKVRRLSIEASGVNVEVIKKEKWLRTFVLRDKSDFALDDMCKTVCNLRILDLCNSSISSLPDSLFGLVHLRYLDVSASKLISIPSSIENLRNLACLWCTNCTELSQVPESICNLRELRCLGFQRTKVEAIPTGLNNLEKLTDLHGFKPYKNNLERFSSLDGLESLSQLIQLRLEGLERVSDRNIAKKANLRSKNQLKQLHLKYTLLNSEEQLSQTNEKKIVIEDVLNELCPPSSLELFAIEGYFGRCLPNWLNLRAALPNLTDLYIENCACFEELAPLGQLPNLVSLRIKGVYSIVGVGEEFLGRDIQSKDVIATSCPVKPAFPKLSDLEFFDLPKWKEWRWNMGQPAMPKLKNLVIQVCPQLRSLPEGLSHHAISLESLEIAEADKLIFVEKLPSIRDIRVSNNLFLERVSNLPSISYIQIYGCPNLKTLEDLKSLQRMGLIDFEMETLPDYLATTMLQKLTVRCSEELLLKIVSEGGSGSEWNRFKHIPNVTIYSPGIKPLYVTYQKTPFSFTTNTSTSELNEHADEICDICKHVPHVEARKTSQASGSHKRKQEVGDQATQLFNIDKGFPHPSFKVDKASFFGRDVEKMKVIDYLLSEKEKSFSVISIVGKGGLGKTTIAQLVYKDLRASRCFDLFGWVCVSEGFDVRRLTKATVESISKVNYGMSELSPLQEELAKFVKEKSILLILDDVWNEDQSLWQLFRVPFKEAKMVRILVTTRNEKVAKVMQTMVCLSPTNLPEDSCWQLFQHYTLNGTSHLVPTHLVDMGMAIMRKCGGLPLGVKLIASLLRHETYEQGWREILESDLWESNASGDIFPALQISYARLPAHLRPCFLLCSMYPKDYILKKMNLIDLWISHGYIESKGERKITEIGIEYYEELKERSFLDDFSNCISECWELQQRYFLDDSSNRFSECCKLHDIIHDLARNNSEKEHYSVEINQPLDIQKGNFSIETHHLYAGGFMGYVNQILQQNQQNLKGLRTLSMDLRGCSGGLEHQCCINNTEAVDVNSKLSVHYEECSGEVTICDLIKFEALMVLELKAYNLAKIPDSISMLKHLVHLAITSSSLKMLPSSIGLLYNLQTLILDCFSLEYLPECIGNLANLQFLHIQSGTIKKLPESLCSLSNLLRLVIISNDLEEVPLDIKNICNLHALTIRSNRIQALPNTIGCLRSLKELNLLSLGGSYDDLPDGKLEYVPHAFVNFPAIKTMAAWLGVRTINWLKDMKGLEGKLSIGGLKNMSNLEDAQHANLRNKCKLETSDLCWDPGYYISPYDVKSELRLSLIPEACEGGLVGVNDVVSFSLLECLQPHPNLKKLLVRWYPSATVPNWMRDPSSFRSIQEVLLECCANIQSLPFENFHSLKHLTIVACYSIRVLQLEQVSSQLEKLQIVSCGNLELITGLGDLDMLAALEIYSCQALKSLTMGGMQLVLSTETFGDSSHEKPHTGQQSIASLRRLEIENCYLLHFLPDGLIPPGPCHVCVRGCGCPDMERNLTSAINEISCSSNLWRWR